MVLFFIADLALTLAFKLGAWCLGKTCDGIVYLIKPTPTNPASNEQLILDDDCVIIKRCEYEELKQLHNSHKSHKSHNSHNSHKSHKSHHLSESESESESLVVESSSLPPSK